MANVDKPQLKQWLDSKQDLLLVDVLPKESFDKQHLPGAINIPVKNNADFIKQVGSRARSKDQRIVTYCAGPQCDASKQAAQKLESAGFTNVQTFEEGLQGWFSPGQVAA